MNNRYGGDMVAGLGATAAETVEKTYGNRKTIEADELLGGHAIEEHVGKSDNWFGGRLRRGGEILFASSYRNLEAANRAVAQFETKKQFIPPFR